MKLTYDAEQFRAAESARKWREKAIRESMTIGNMRRDIWRMSHLEGNRDFAGHCGSKPLPAQVPGVVAPIYRRKLFRALTRGRILLRFVRPYIGKGH